VSDGHLVSRPVAGVGPGVVLIVPVGSLTTVDPSLPAGAALVLATRFADELARRLGPLGLVAPPIGFGVVDAGAEAGSGAVSGAGPGADATPRSVSAIRVGVSADTLARVLVDLATSALPAAGGPMLGVMFVNADAGNLPALRQAGPQLLREAKRAYHWTLRSDAHGLGRTIIDACLLLHLAPHLVGDGVEDLRPIPTHELGESLFHDYSDDLEHAVRGLFDV
jgi:hypothetical protein